MVRKSVKLVLLLSMVLLGCVFVLRAEDSVITAAPDDTGPPFVRTETYEADIDDLQVQIDDLLFSGAASVVTGNFFGDDAVPVAPYPIEVDLSSLGDVAASDVTVTASAFKYMWFGTTYESAFVLWEVTESPLTATLRVYNKNGTEYDPLDGGWIGSELRLSYIAAVSGGGALPSTDQQIVSGGLEGVCHDPADAGAPDDTLPGHPFEFDISELDASVAEDVAVTISGFKMSDIGVIEGPLWFDWEVTTSPYPLTLRINVWDELHNPYDFTDGINWEDKRLKLSYIAATPGGGTAMSGEKVVVDLNLDEDGNIVTELIGGKYDYQGKVTRLYLRHLPNLKARLGGTGITLTMVNDRVKKLLLSAETYVDATQDSFEGFRWAREMYGYATVDVADNEIYWEIKVYEDQHTATEDTDATYKLIRVEAHLN